MDYHQVRELEALEAMLGDPNAESIKVSYGLLKFITDEFSHEIGRGGFGVVYKGHLGNGVVAVKRSNGLTVTDKQFMHEIKCLKSANHNNVVRFLAYCADTQEEVMPLDGTFVMAGERNRLLCFEFVPNGNVRQYLEQEKSHGDDWPTRYKMIRGICEGLQYLHENKVNHLDLKPENVMLDAHMEAKITDFGLSRFLDQGQSRIITQHICGTLRYIAPEVIDKNELSFKSDMYALGIIIIELLTATSMISLENWDAALYLLNCPRAGLCAEIARSCTHAERDDRPTIHEVIRRIDELESKIPKSSTTNQLVAPTAFPGTQLLDVYPQELRFLFVPDEDEMSFNLTITNNTDYSISILLIAKDNPYSAIYRYEYIRGPMCSVVVRMRTYSKEELPSDLVEWEIVLFTIRCSDQVFYELEQTISWDENRPFEDVIKTIQEFAGGDMHRAALRASVAVAPGKLEVHTLGQDEETIAIHSIDVHPTEPWVLFSTGDTVYIWNWQTDDKVGECNSPGLTVGESNEAKFIAREKWVVLGDTNGSIIVLTCPTMDHVTEFVPHDGLVSEFAVHPTRPFLLTFSFGHRHLNLWDWSRDWCCTRTFLPSNDLSNVMFNPKHRNTFATLDVDGSVQMWDIDRAHPTTSTDYRCRENTYSTQNLTYTGHQDIIASVDTQYIRLWDRKGENVYTLCRPEDYYVHAVCHPTRPIFVTAGYFGLIEVWDSSTYRLKKAYDNVTKDHIIYIGFTGSRRLVIGYKKGISVLDIDLE